MRARAPSFPSSPVRPPGTVPLALVLVALGIAVLIEWLGVVEVPWEGILPLALVIVGLAHVAGAQRDRHVGLTLLGMAIVIVLALSDVVDLPFADRLTSQESAAGAPAPAPEQASVRMRLP